MKDPEKVLLPSRDLVPITLREYESDHCVPFAVFDHFLLDLRHGSEIKRLVSG